MASLCHSDMLVCKWVTLPKPKPPPVNKSYDDLLPTHCPLPSSLFPLPSAIILICSFSYSYTYIVYLADHDRLARHQDMKKMNLILKKCKTLSRQLGRTSSYSSLRSKSTREEIWGGGGGGGVGGSSIQEDEDFCEIIYVGSSKRRYLIKSKHLNHPLVNALIEKSDKKPGDQNHHPSVKCEVVLFDHLLWMLDNADPNLTTTSDSLEELADLYAL